MRSCMSPWRNTEAFIIIIITIIIITINNNNTEALDGGKLACGSSRHCSWPVQMRGGGELDADTGFDGVKSATNIIFIQPMPTIT